MIDRSKLTFFSYPSQTEAPLLIKQYIPIMTKSELHSALTSGFATVAGSVMGAYISFGVNPAHVLSASVMSAPAALTFAKLFYPETRESKIGIKNVTIQKRLVDYFLFNMFIQTNFTYTYMERERKRAPSTP